MLSAGVGLLRASLQVHHVMGVSMPGDASVFQLECDRSRVRYGIILLAFEFDPPAPSEDMLVSKGRQGSW